MFERPSFFALIVIPSTSENISLGKAANLAGVSAEQMKDILRARGVELRLGPGNDEEAAQDIASIREHARAKGR